VIRTYRRMVIMYQHNLYNTAQRRRSNSKIPRFTVSTYGGYRRNTQNLNGRNKDRKSFVESLIKGKT
ncbi:hypothetical protein ACCS64_38650, partial [Rhizobium ruizarguesonis]